MLVNLTKVRFAAGPPVAVGMNIDIASIDMVSEVNMVSTFSWCIYKVTLKSFECFHLSL